MTKILALPKELVLTMALCGIVVIAPLIHSQLVTGTIVNAALFSAVMLVGFRAAVSVAVIPSLIALMAGTLPAAMAPMVPLIIVSNVALAGIFSLLREKNYWMAAAASALAKFMVLAVGANIILSAMTHGNIAIALASAMGWPQLITAVLGAVLAFAVCERKSLKRV